MTPPSFLSENQDDRVAYDRTHPSRESPTREEHAGRGPRLRNSLEFEGDSREISERRRKDQYIALDASRSRSRFRPKAVLQE
jgi:hypothetical protein